MEHILTIKDFKAFENQPLKLRSLTVLAGSNSVGKSTIIQSLLISRFVFQEYLRFGSEIKGKNIPLNGPFLLELGNTTEVVRRGKKVSDSKFSFTLEIGGNKKMELEFDGDISSLNNYHIKILNADFNSADVNFLQERFYYLCAERIGPRLKYEYEVQTFPHAGFKGENTFQLLFGDNLPVEEKRLFKKENPALLFDQVRKWLDYIIPGAKFDNANPMGRSKVIQGTYGDSLPPNVGFGISYVLPVIVNGLIAKKGSVFIVENPEAHLHPSGQSRIGRFLAQIASDNVNVIIETHSEHVLNGIRLAVLEGDKINPNDVIVNFISIIDSKVQVEEIKMDETAEYNDYPPGFIDQEQRDIAEMVRIKKAKNAKS